MHRYCRAAWLGFHSDCAKCIGVRRQGGSAMPGILVWLLRATWPTVNLVLLIKRASRRQSLFIPLQGCRAKTDWPLFALGAAPAAAWTGLSTMGPSFGDGTAAPSGCSASLFTCQHIPASRYPATAPRLHRAVPALSGCLHELLASSGFGYRIGAREI
jgi:hypothetical protein